MLDGWMDGQKRICQWIPIHYPTTIFRLTSVFTTIVEIFIFFMNNYLIFKIQNFNNRIFLNIPKDASFSFTIFFFGEKYFLKISACLKII
jgi:hypothetical protein